MSDGVKWIHITADVFDNWKVKHLKAMPEIGHALVCIWFELLCLAGKCNHPSGFIVMSEKFIISDEMIADMFNEDVKLVQMALQTFEKLGMIQITDSHAIQISNWFEYQNEAGLAQIRGYEREKKANYRAKAALRIEQNKSTDVSMDNSMDSSISISISNSLSNSKSKEIKKDTKHKYGEYKHILLTDKELDKLNTEYGEIETQEAIKYLDEYIEMKGTKYKSHYLVLRKWVYSAVQRDKKNNSRSVMDEWANA